MSGDKDIEASEQIASSPVSESPHNLSEKDMVKDAIPSKSVPPVSAVASAVSETKAAIEKPTTLEQGVYYPATSYDYYYPGYNGAFGQPDDKRYYNASGGSYTSTQSDSNSLLYMYPGYAAYQTGTEYFPQPESYGSDVFPCYTYDSTYSGNSSTGPVTRSVKSVMGPSGSGKSNGYNVTQTSAMPVNSKFQQFSNISKPFYQNQALKPLNKLSSGFQTTGLTKEYHPTSKFSSLVNRNSGGFLQYSPVNYQSNGRAWNNYKSKSHETFGRNSGFEPLTELTRGPRSETRNFSPELGATEVKQNGLAIKNGKYNLKEFQTEYENAKFFVIKSYSEDDVHKCIKYDVWSSTPNGNKKLDAAFREADAKTSETGVKCPVFLFFSVNGSGQFVGVTEMIGQVDFSKNMDFWQLDKWNGFFPIKWHIIKDVPNTMLLHIILENNENKPVTYSRDTQEIGLKQGLEMLSIFKNYAERTSVVDDFNFYENREKSLKGKRKPKPASQAKAGIADPSSLVSITKNLSIGPQNL